MNRVSKIALFSISISLFGSFAHADTKLYSRLRARYQGSNAPFELDSLIAKSESASTFFKSCVWSSADGSFWSMNYVRALRFDIRRTDGGPLDPPERNSLVALVDQNFLNVALQTGGRFREGAFDVDGITSWEANRACGNESFKIAYKTSSSSLSSDKKSYVTQYRYGSGEEFQRYNYVRSGPYLVMRYKSSTETNYGYCWK